MCSLILFLLKILYVSLSCNDCCISLYVYVYLCVRSHVHQTGGGIGDFLLSFLYVSNLFMMCLCHFLQKNAELSGQEG